MRKPKLDREELRDIVRRLSFLHLSISDTPNEFREMLKLINDIEGYKIEKKEVKIDSTGLTKAEQLELANSMQD